jgi:hypothetical protein
LAQDRGRCRAVVNAVMKLRVMDPSAKEPTPGTILKLIANFHCPHTCSEIINYHRILSNINLTEMCTNHYRYIMFKICSCK